MAELFRLVKYYNLPIYFDMNQQEYELNQRIIDISGLHTG